METIIRYATKSSPCFQVVMEIVYKFYYFIPFYYLKFDLHKLERQLGRNFVKNAIIPDMVQHVYLFILSFYYYYHLFLICFIRSTFS